MKVLWMMPASRTERANLVKIAQVAQCFHSRLVPVILQEAKSIDTVDFCKNQDHQCGVLPFSEL